MRIRPSLVAAAALCAAGFTAAILVFPTVASAWNWQNLPNGYSVSVATYTNLGGDSCDRITINGHYMGDSCVDEPGLEANVNAYVESTVCTVNPGADPGLCATTTSTTTTTATTTTDPGQTTTDPGSGQPADSPPATTTGPVAAPPATTTDPDAAAIGALQAQIAALQQQQDLLAARVAALETGQILGELKDEPPFTNPA